MSEKNATGEDFAHAVAVAAERARAFWRDALTKYAASVTDERAKGEGR